MSKRNKNKYEIYDNLAIIVTTKGERITVDRCDLDSLKNHSWYITTRGYAATTVGGKRIYLHRLLMNPDKYQVDHINRNKLDNRRYNLRLVTNQENHFNKTENRNNTSGKAGVYHHTQCDRWCVQITVNGKTIHGGLFKEFSKAVEAREALERKYFSFNNHQSNNKKG